MSSNLGDKEVEQKYLFSSLHCNEQVSNAPTTPFSQGTQLAISPITSTRQPLIRSAFETRAAKSKNDWESFPSPPFFSLPVAALIMSSVTLHERHNHLSVSLISPA